MDSRTSNNDENKWVEERIAQLSPPPGWRPDTEKAFESILQRAKPESMSPRLRLLMAGATIAVIGVIVVLLPWKALWTPASPETPATFRGPVPQTPAATQASEPEDRLNAELEQKAPVAAPDAQTAPPQRPPDIQLQIQDPLTPRKKKEPRAIIAEAESQKDSVPSFAQGPGPQTPPSGVTQPVIISQVQPAYTDEARQARVQGTVIVSTTVREDGTTKVERIVQSVGYGLDEAAAAAVEMWKFIPGKKDGQPVAVTINISIHFGLK